MTLVVRPAMTDSPDGSSGGTDVNKAFVDSLLDTVDDQCHSTTNPTLKPKAVTDEVKTARGNKASLNARLTVGMDADGNLTMPASFTALQTEVQTARGASPDLDTRLDAVDTLLAGAKGNKTTVAARLANTMDNDGFINSPYSKHLKHTAGVGANTGPAHVRVSIDYTQRNNSLAAETDAHSFTLKGGSLDEDGDTLTYVASGTLANNANAKTFRFKFGSAVMSANMPISGTYPWRFQAEVVRLTATTQIILGAMWAGTAVIGILAAVNGVETLANDITVKTTLQGGATNDITQYTGKAVVE